MRRLPAVTASLAIVAVLTAACSSDPSSAPEAGASAIASAAPEASTPVDSSPGAAEPSPTAAGSGSAVSFSNLTGTDTRLTIDGGFLSTLSTLGISIDADGGAGVDKAGGQTTFVFPVTGGQATLDPNGSDAFTGSVQHRGGLRLSALGRSVTIDGLVLDGGSDQLTASVAGRTVPLLPLSPDDAKITASGGSATLTDDAVSLSADARQGIADNLGLPTSLPELTFGSLKVSLTGS